MGEGEEIEELRGEVARLAAENDELRSRFRIGPSDPDEAPQEERGVAVFLTPDPAEQPRRDGPGPEAVANLARIVIPIMEGHRADLDWRVEHDLARIPEGAACYQLGEAMARMMGGSGPPPRTFRVDRDDEGGPSLRRCLIPGEPDSDRYQEGNDRLNREFDEIAAEGEAAIGAGARHHAGWALKALDVVIAEMNTRAREVRMWPRRLARGVRPAAGRVSAAVSIAGGGAAGLLEVGGALASPVPGAGTHVMAPIWRYTRGMTSIQIKNVPDDVHGALRARAAAAGQSLQEYLLGELSRQAREPALDEVLDRAGGRPGGSLGFAFAVESVRADRDRGD